MGNLLSKITAWGMGTVLALSLVLSGILGDAGSTASAAASQASDIVNYALSQVGMKERSVGSDNIIYNDWYYHRQVKNSYGGEYSWCQVFVSYCANKVGISTNIIPKMANCQQAVNFFRKQGRYYRRNSGYQPKVGDIIYLSTNGSSTAHHVGIVYAVDNTDVYYVDGNNTLTDPHSVRKTKKHKNSAGILGYAAPKYIGQASSPTTPVKAPETAVISNVTIHSINADKILFSWQTTGKRSVVVVTDGAKTWKSGFYTSANPTCTFNRGDIPGCSKTVQIRIYSYINSGDASVAGQGESCHLMTYGEIGYVSFPERSIQSWVETLPQNMIAQGKFIGWIVSDRAISSVKITVNGKAYNALLTNRTDVTQAYPSYSYARGWFVSITPYEIKDGSNTYEIVANFSDGGCYLIQSGTFQAEKIDCLFDPAYFKARYYRDSEVRKLTTDEQLEKYYYHNLNKSYEPSMLFSPMYYIGSANADLNKKGWNGIQSYEHFVHYGIKSQKEYRAVSEFVNLCYLHQKYADLRKMTPEQLLEWTANWGLKIDQRLLADTDSAKAFKRFYNCREYAAMNADLISAYSKPVMVSDFRNTQAEKYWRHLWKYGIVEKRNLSKSFCAASYIKNAKLNSNASAYQIFNHFVTVGYARGIKTR